MIPSKYKLNIDFETNEVHYTDFDSGHGKPIKLKYDDLRSKPEIMDNFSGSDAYLLGTIYASKALGKLQLQSIKPRYKFFTLISILFSTVMLISNILSTKLVYFFGTTVTGAMLVYPFSYIFDYVITDIYGYQNARRVILSTIAALVIFDLSIFILMIMPPSPYWHLQPQLIAIFGKMLRTFCSSTVAFSLSFFVSSYLLQKNKINGCSLFKRVFRSMLVSEIFDTGVFCVLAFTGIWPLHAMAKFMIVSYFTKATYELFVYKILTKPIINFVKSKEKLDLIDTETDFTPFSWNVDYSSKNNVYSAKQNLKHA